MNLLEHTEMLVMSAALGLGVVLRELDGVPGGSSDLGFLRGPRSWIEKNLNPVNIAKKIAEGFANGFNFVMKEIRESLSELPKAWKSLTRDLQKAAHWINRYNPAFVALRKGYLVALKLNALDVANRIKYGAVTNLDAEITRGVTYGEALYGISPAQTDLLQKGFKTAWDIYYTLGGNYPPFVKAIYENRDEDGTKYYHRGMVNGTEYLADDLITDIQARIKSGEYAVSGLGNSPTGFFTDPTGYKPIDSGNKSFERVQLGLYEQLRKALIMKYEAVHLFYKRLEAEHPKGITAGEVLRSLQSMDAQKLKDIGSNAIPEVKKKRALGCLCEELGGYEINSEDARPLVLGGLMMPRPDRDYGAFVGDKPSLEDYAEEASKQFDPNAEIDHIAAFDEENDLLDNINPIEAARSIESGGTIEGLGVDPATASIVGSAIAALTSVALVMVCPKNREAECNKVIDEGQKLAAAEAKRRIAEIDKAIPEKETQLNALVKAKDAEFAKNGGSDAWLAMDKQVKDLMAEIERLYTERTQLRNAAESIQQIQYDPQTGAAYTPSNGNRPSALRNNAPTTASILPNIDSKWLWILGAVGLVGVGTQYFKPLQAPKSMSGVKGKKRKTRTINLTL